MSHETQTPGPEFIKPFVPSVESQHYDDEAGDELERPPITAEELRQLQIQAGIVVVRQEVSKPVEVPVRRTHETDSEPTVNHVPEPEQEQTRVFTKEQRETMTRQAHIANRLGGGE